MEKIFVKDICQLIEQQAPLQLQEPYDNSGLIVGLDDQQVDQVLITVDVTMEVLEEAINNRCQMIISHHPLIFGGLKKITAQDETSKIVYTAILHSIAIYAAHTNLDNVPNGINGILADKLGIQNPKILSPKSDLLQKLVYFVPKAHKESINKVIFKAGAGVIGNYDFCAFSSLGKGSFRASESTDPFVGKKGSIHYEDEERVETIIPKWKKSSILKALIQYHPYEEVAYDIYPVDAYHPNVGAGMIGELSEEIDTLSFLRMVKEICGCGCIRHTSLIKTKIKRVAICGGSGSFLLPQAINLGADMFITGDMKYHDFFETKNRTIIADIGHYESEQFSKELISSFIKEKFPTFAVRLSKVNTNSIKYL